MQPTLLILAAGMGSRYGGLKQIDGIGPNEEPIIEYSIYDAINSGFGKIVFVIRKEFDEAFSSRFDKFSDKIDIEYAYQEVNVKVDGITTIERTKPWGTSHAVLVAKDIIGIKNKCSIRCAVEYAAIALTGYSVWLKMVL